jgi:hypothetical protein
MELYQDHQMTERPNLPEQQEFVAYLRSQTTIKELAEKTDIKKTTIEHWFRKDKTGFSHPSIEDWETIKPHLKELKYDKEMTMIESIEWENQKMWPTPTQDMTTERKKKYAQGGKPLTMAVQEAEQKKMWPTPSSRDYKGGSGTVKEKDGKYYRQSNTTGTKFGVRLDALVEYQEKQKMWPTPRASAAMSEKSESIKKRVERKGRLGAKLEESVAMVPTPTARDYKGARKPETLKKAGRNENNSLPDKVAARQKGSLNPDWVEWLMGYPPGWTDIKDSE